MFSMDSGDLKNIAENLFSSFVWLLIAILATLFYTRLRNMRVRGRVRKANEKSLISASLITISGSRFELTRAQLRFNTSNEVLRIAFPENMRGLILKSSPDFVFYPAVMTNRVAEFMVDACRLVPDFHDILSLSISEVAREFVDRASRLERLFNGDMFHVLNFGNSATYDDREDPTVTMEFYETDYFSHQVVHKAFTHIRNRKEVLNSLDLGHIPPALRFFLNGFGLNCLVCAFPDRKNSLSEAVLVFGRRSSRVAVNSASGTWHVTANEALSKTDVEDQRISVDRWIRRALDEEVGIRESEIIRTFIFNVNVSITDMQPGLFCLALCEIGQAEIGNRIIGSQDGMLEYDDYRVMPFEDSAIMDALQQGGLMYEKTGRLIPFSPSSDNILRNIIARGTGSFVKFS